MKLFFIVAAVLAFHSNAIAIPVNGNSSVVSHCDLETGPRVAPDVLGDALRGVGLPAPVNGQAGT